MDFEWDQAKSEWNRTHRGFGFEIVYEFDWDSSITQQSPRGDELRFISVGYGPLGLPAIVWTPRQGRTRVISVRRVHSKEARDRGFQ
jgi:uncharacterized protein